MLVKKNKKNQLILKITASCFILLLVVFLFSPIVHAQDLAQEMDQNLSVIGDETGMQKLDPRIIVGRIIKSLLGLLGALAISIVIYSGYQYMTAAGDPTKVSAAQKRLVNGFIGLVIIIFAYAITTFIFNMLLGANTPGSGVHIAGSPTLGAGYGLSSGAFGDVIQSHYPEPEQTGVPRNTMILVTFKEAIDPSTIIDNNIETTDMNKCPDGLGAILCGPISQSAFRVYKCQDMIDESQPEENLVNCLQAEIFDIEDSNKLVPGYVMMTEDKRTIILNPYGDSDQHMGSSVDDVPYIVFLTNIIENENDMKVFGDPDGYKWRFTTSTIIDLVPPQISSVVPADVAYAVDDPSGCNCSPNKIGCADVDCDGLVYLNQGVYINFNEPVIPPLTQTQNCTAGDSDNETQMTNEEILSACDTKHIPGYWNVGINQYRTVQFTSSTECPVEEGQTAAKNSCGDPVYCLPAEAAIYGDVLAAEILAGGVALPGSGIMDMGGNSLDGNADGVAEGLGLDDYGWDFETGDTLDLIPPYITELIPSNRTELIADSNLIIKATANENLDAYSVDTEIKLIGDEYGVPFGLWYDPNLGMEVVIDELGEEKKQVVMNKMFLSHGPFQKWDGVDENIVPLYSPIMKSQVKDTRFNCFSPTTDAGVDAAKNYNVLNSNCKDTVNEPGSSCCPEVSSNNSLTVSNTEECTPSWDQ